MMYSNIPSPELLQDEVILKAASDKKTKSSPVVTVVTVCFNPLKDGRRELLTKNMDSVQQQTGVAVEQIIVDGASTDGTLEFLKSYENNSHDIRILSKADSGIYEAMNRGIALARGKYVVFLNSDDYYCRYDGLAMSVKVLEETQCGFSFAPIKQAGSPIRHRLHRHPHRHLHRFFLFCTIPHPSMLFLKSALMEVNGYDCSYRLAADYDMMLRLIAAKQKVCFVRDAFVQFSTGGFSNKNRMLNLQEKTQIVRSFHREVFNIELSDGEMELLVRHYRYPRKYLSVYVESQRIIRRTFVGVPKTPMQRVVEGFNFWKYYLKCLFNS